MSNNDNRNWRTNRDHLDQSIVEIDYNSEKSPGDLSRLAVTLNSVKTHNKVKEDKKVDKYQEFAWKLKKLVNLRVMVMPIISGTLETPQPQMSGKETGETGYQRKYQRPPD